MVQEVGETSAIDTTKTVQITKFNVFIDFELVIYEVKEFPFCVFVVRLIPRPIKNKIFSSLTFLI